MSTPAEELDLPALCTCLRDPESMYHNGSSLAEEAADRLEEMARGISETVNDRARIEDELRAEIDRLYNVEIKALTMAEAASREHAKRVAEYAGELETALGSLQEMLAKQVVGIPEDDRCLCCACGQFDPDHSSDCIIPRGLNIIETAFGMKPDSVHQVNHSAPDAADAARYRWWRKWWCDGPDDCERVNSLDYDADDPASFDRAVDAEIAKDASRHAAGNKS